MAVAEEKLHWAVGLSTTGGEGQRDIRQGLSRFTCWMAVGSRGPRFYGSSESWAR